LGRMRNVQGKPGKNRLAWHGGWSGFDALFLPGMLQKGIVGRIWRGQDNREGEDGFGLILGPF